jgi:hypothetical protein
VASGQSVHQQTGPFRCETSPQDTGLLAYLFIRRGEKKEVHDDSICNFTEDIERAYSRSPLIGNSRHFLINICCLIEWKVSYYCGRNKPKI